MLVRLHGEDGLSATFLGSQCKARFGPLEFWPAHVRRLRPDSNCDRATHFGEFYVECWLGVVVGKGLLRREVRVLGVGNWAK